MALIFTALNDGNNPAAIPIKAIIKTAVTALSNCNCNWNLPNSAKSKCCNTKSANDNMPTPTTIPAKPASNANTRLSVTIWMIIENGVAPNALFTPIS